MAGATRWGSQHEQNQFMIRQRKAIKKSAAELRKDKASKFPPDIEPNEPFFIDMAEIHGVLEPVA